MPCSRWLRPTAPRREEPICWIWPGNPPTRSTASSFLKIRPSPEGKRCHQLHPVVSGHEGKEVSGSGETLPRHPRRENSVNRSRHNQSWRPVLEQSEAAGHAVNAASLMVSLIDVGVLTGIREYFDTADRLWRDVIGTKLYITGGIGSTGNEGFGRPYSLPNLSAYCESCAAFMFIAFNHRLFLATGDGRYIDVMERTMYSNAVDGVSATGDRFFYVNRLASAGDGRDHRWEKASLECCPPNLVRFLHSCPVTSSRKPRMRYM